MSAIYFRHQSTLDFNNITECLPSHLILFEKLKQLKCGGNRRYSTINAVLYPSMPAPTAAWYDLVAH